MNPNEGRRLLDVIEDIKPLIAKIARAQREWLDLADLRDPGGPHNAECVIGILAVGFAIQDELAKRGYTVDEINDLTTNARLVAPYVRFAPTDAPKPPEARA